MTDCVRETLESERQTELSRLGSSKALYATTRGTMDGPAIAAANRAMSEAIADRLADRDASWAEDLERRARSDAERLADLAGEPGDPLIDPALGEEAAALGTLIGWATVAIRLAEQETGYFVGQARPGDADTVRSVVDSRERFRERVCSAIEDAGVDRDAVEAAAIDLVDAAYEAYVDRLEAEGIEPKSIC
ncbi:MAG: rubrerythrin family protein [Halococcoides sp.]